MFFSVLAHHTTIATGSPLLEELYTDPGKNNLLTSSASGKEPICQCKTQETWV